MMDDDIRGIEGVEGKGLSAEEVNKKPWSSVIMKWKRRRVTL